MNRPGIYQRDLVAALKRCRKAAGRGAHWRQGSDGKSRAVCGGWELDHYVPALQPRAPGWALRELYLASEGKIGVRLLSGPHRLTSRELLSFLEGLEIGLKLNENCPRER